MITYKYTCVCGRVFELQDERSSYINPGGIPDNDGNKFLIQRDYKNIIKQHQDCNLPSTK